MFNNALFTHKLTLFLKSLQKNYQQIILHKEKEKKTSREFKNILNKNKRNNFLNVHFNLPFFKKVDQDQSQLKDLKLFTKIQRFVK